MKIKATVLLSKHVSFFYKMDCWLHASYANRGVLLKILRPNGWAGGGEALFGNMKFESRHILEIQKLGNIPHIKNSSFQQRPIELQWFCSKIMALFTVHNILA